MCGICGYVGLHQPELLEAMTRVIAHRGPDNSGFWSDAAGQVGFGHRRLSIIDLSPAGHQPMCNEDGTVWITFNGEIYDFEQLRERLLAAGHQFRSHSDTEVLLHLYEERGADFLQELNGMFALAIWDCRTRELLLARDHVGIKPLYYWQDGARLFFSSEIKSLLQVPGVPRRLDQARVPEYLTFLWVPGDLTMFEGIRKLEPGHLLRWKDGRAEVRRWFTLEYEPESGASEDEWAERVHDTFMRTTRRQMVSDVPLGAFLSGGADSSSIVACMRHSFPQREIKCYTAWWSKEDNARDGFVDDLPYAQRVAEKLGVNLTSFQLTTDVVKLLPKMIYHLDEPDADPAVFPAYMIAKRAREEGITVLLSGTGGDEIFFGYRSHEAVRKYAQYDWVPSWAAAPALSAATGTATALMGAQAALPRRLRKFSRGLTRRGLARHLELADWSSPAVRRELYSQELTRRFNGVETPPACYERYAAGFRGHGELNFHSHMLNNTFLAAHNFLYSDKTSMAASIEARVPFMDLELMRLMARAPESLQMKGGETKHLLKKAMQRYLPNDVLYRSKTGFGAPLRKWIAGDLDPLIADCLSAERLRERGLFEPSAVERVIRANRENRGDHAFLIYALLNLELWQRTFIDQPGVEQTI